jgi:cell division protein FtsB
MSKRLKQSVKLTRLEARTRVIQGAGKLALLACCLSLGFVVVATAFPQRRELEKLELKLKLAREREMKVTAERDHRRIELRALREDPSYLEIQARDRLDYSREGERVLRFRRDR